MTKASANHKQLNVIANNVVTYNKTSFNERM